MYCTLFKIYSICDYLATKQAVRDDQGAVLTKSTCTKFSYYSSTLLDSSTKFSSLLLVLNLVPVLI